MVLTCVTEIYNAIAHKHFFCNKISYIRLSSLADVDINIFECHLCLHLHKQTRV